MSSMNLNCMMKMRCHKKDNKYAFKKPDIIVENLYFGIYTIWKLLAN